MARRGLAALLVLVWGTLALRASAIDGTDLARAREMLDTVKLALQSHYFDPTYGGHDIDALFKDARARLASVGSLDDAYSIIRRTVATLADSHTHFIPPLSPYEYRHGWEMQPAGDACYVSAVHPGSDAEAKSLRPGDRVRLVDGQFEPRRGLCSLRHAAYVLNPKPWVQVLVERPDGSRRALDLRATPTPREDIVVTPDNAYGLQLLERNRRLGASRVRDIGSIRVWRLSGFEFEAHEMDRAAAQALQGASAVILDLRGNGGGSVDALVQMTRHFFTREVHLADLKGRRRTRPLVASRRRNGFGGPLIVLVDGATASAAEIFARVVQLEQRGTVVGDQTAGFVRQSQIRVGSVPIGDGLLAYGVSVSEADVIMRDGHGLERVGVTPDVARIPAVEDLAHRRDPVLAQAITLLGGSLDPQEAARLFPHLD
jgi:C-terminal processing protease CtpA/Prc